MTYDDDRCSLAGIRTSSIWGSIGIVAFVFGNLLEPSLLGAQGVRHIPSPHFEKCVQIDPEMMQGQADAGVAQGEYCVAYYYLGGQAGRPKNPAQALQYFRKAAAHRHVDATGYVGYCYRH